MGRGLRTSGGFWLDGWAQNLQLLPVRAKAITSIAVSPSTATISALTSQSFTATATYNDLTTADISATASWTSSNPSIAISGGGGSFTGLAAGFVTITAQDVASGVTGTAGLTVTPAVTYGTSGRYPLTATATRFALGYGTWSAGYLCDDTSSPLTPKFGSGNLSASSGSPTFSQTGALGPTDTSVKIVNIDQLSTGSTSLYDTLATSDLAYVGVLKFSDSTSFDIVTSKGSAGVDANLWVIWKSANTLNIRYKSGTNQTDVSVPFTLANTWVVVMALVDRATGTVRIGWCSLASDATIQLSANTTVVGGSLSNTTPLTIGCNGSYGANGSTTYHSGFYIASGVGAAAGLAANMRSALLNIRGALFPTTLSTYTTQDILRTGRGRLVWAAVVEGYPYILTSHTDPRQIVNAWNNGTTVDWQLALPGLSVSLDRNHVLNPWEPFDKGSDFQLSVAPEQFPLYGQVADQFGIDVAKRNAGAETQLTSTLDRAGTTINVKATSTFPTSGDLYVGTECIEATVATSTTFTVTKRGKYSALQTAYATNYAEHHRVGTDALGVQLEPVVSQYPRNWAGKWVSLYLHWSDGTHVNPLSTALLAYSGRWQSESDDGTATTVNVKSVLDGVANATFGRDMWSAKVQAGFWIYAGQTLTLSDNDYNGSWKTANPLTVVASGASGTNQINAGKYTREDLATAINNWLAGEKIAGRIFGYYFLNPAENVVTTGTDIRSVFHWFIPSTAAYGEWTMTWPWGSIFGGFASTFTINPEISNAWHPAKSPGQPFADNLFNLGNGFFVNCTIEQAGGHFVDQYALLPASIKAVLPANGGGLLWGVFMFNEQTLFVGSFVDGTTEIDNMQTVDTAIVGGLTDVSALHSITLNPGDPLPPIRQIFLMEDAAGSMLKKLAYSTGTTAHNHSVNDVLGYGLGLALPAQLLGTVFDNSVDGLPFANSTIMVRIDKPTKFSDLFRGDLVLRRAFPKWKQGGLQFGQWYTPTADLAIKTLDETNKAEPSGNKSPHNSVTTEDTTFTKNTIKVLYNRDFSADANYAATLILEDRTAVDDAGGEGATVEIQACNSYGQFQNTGTAIEALWPGFMASASMFTRPTSKVVRSADLTLFEDLSIGDTVLFSDKTARDPATGQRGVLLRPALITRHHVNYGRPGVPPVGEVELFFMPQDRIASYAPSALVDSSINTGGFSAGYSSAAKQLQTVSHDFSEASETLDAGQFQTNDDVRITEVDPFDPANPLTWTRTVAGVSGNIITLNSTLTSPAWDATKTYQITYDHFGADQTSQKLKSFQSSSVTGQLESLGAPYQYGIQPSPSSFTANTGNEQAELYAQISYGDGKPRDTGYDRAIIRSHNALIDYRSAKQAPVLSNTVQENTTYNTGNGWQLAYLYPFFVGTERYAQHVLRYLRVAPFFRSDPGFGGTVSLRVTISVYPTTSSSKNDVAFYSPSTSVTFTTSSTTWGTATEQDVPILFRPSDGIVWVHVEVGYHCQTRGLALCKEGKRQ